MNSSCLSSTKALLAMAAMLLLAASGCGSDSDPVADAESLASSHAAKSAGAGKVTLTVGGDTTTFPAGTCNLVDSADTDLVLNSHDLTISMPPQPGAFTEDDRVGVILPPPEGDDFQPSFKTKGTWTKDGDTVSGHVEGTAKLLSTAISGGDPVPFSADFTCPYQDLTKVS